MSEQIGPSDEIVEMLKDPHGYIRRLYGEEMDMIQQASGLKRAILEKRYPQAAEEVAYIRAQQSVKDAQRSATAKEGRNIILRAA
jgi:hypothetical protein